MGEYMDLNTISTALVATCASALLCIVASLIVTIHYMRFSTVTKITGVFKTLLGRITSLKGGSDMKNLPQIDKAIRESFAQLPDSKLLESWQWFMKDVNEVYEGEAAPSPANYLSYDNLIENLRIKWAYLQASFLITFLAFFAMITCPIIPLLTEDSKLLPIGIAIGLIAMLLSLLFFLLVTLSYRSKLNEIGKGMSDIITSVASRLYSAEAPNNTSLILRSNKESMNAYKESVEILTARMNSFISDEVTPAITATFDKTIKDYIGPSIEKTLYSVHDTFRKLGIAQERQVELMCNQFSDIMVNQTSTSISALNQKTSELSEMFKQAGEYYGKVITQSGDVMRQNFDASKQAYDAMIAATEANGKVLDYLKESSETSAAIGESVNILTSLTTQNTATLENMSRSNNETSSNLAERIDGMNAELGKFTTQLEEVSQTTAGVAASTVSSVDGTFAKYIKYMEENLSKIAKSNGDISAKLANASADAAVSVQGLFDKYIDKMGDGIKQILDSNAETSNALAQSVLKIDNIGDEQFEQSAKVASKIIDGISAEVAKLASGTTGAVQEVFQKYAKEMSENVRDVMENNSNTAKMLADSVVKIDNAGSVQFEKASQVASEMIEGISEQMNEAMKGIGTEIAESISSAYKESESVIENLKEGTHKLVAEYEEYFSKINTTTTSLMTDMDVTITSAIQHMADELKVVVDSFAELMEKSSDSYAESSQDIMMKFDEQTRNMGLYAQEINLDVANLSSGLKESVSLFNEEMNKGVLSTFVEFDKGVADFTKRMAGTIEAVREAVEALPEAIRAK
ncbi:hypothetical protein AGMMS49975_21010 [Clostridia bacterium]|nr:hypothetical protein AGMMS49975_21010 [Clostridia bacterium]